MSTNANKLEQKGGAGPPPFALHTPAHAACAA